MSKKIPPTSEPDQGRHGNKSAGAGAEKLETQIHIWMSRDEKIQLIQLAGQRGQKLSDWAKNAFKSYASAGQTEMASPDFIIYQCDDCGGMMVDEHETNCHCSGPKGTWTMIPVVRTRDK